MKALVVSAAALLALASVSHAGFKFTGNGSVSIKQGADKSGSASGVLGHIYNKVGNNEWIGCQRYPGNGFMCHAKNTANVVVGCTANSAHLVTALMALAPDSRITFRWNAAGVCTSIQVTTASDYEDKR